MKTIRKSFLTTILLLITSNLSFSQYPSENLTLLSQYIPASGSALDVDFLDNYAFILDGNALEIVDISDLKNPTLYRRIFPTAPTRKIIIKEIETSGGPNNFAFIYSKNIMFIINIEDVGNIPPFVTFHLQNKIQCGIKSNLLYVLLDSSLNVYDLSLIEDYYQPQLINQINTESKNYGLTIGENYIYLGQEYGIGVIDNGEITDPTLDGEYIYNDSCFLGVMLLRGGVIVGDFLYVPGICQLDIFDISNPTLPSLVFYSPLIYADYTTIESLGFDREYIYYTVSPNQGGLYTVDISEPVAPKKVGYFLNQIKPGGYSVKTYDNVVYYCGSKNTEGHPDNQQGGLFILKNDLITSITKSEDFPNEYYMSQNYPNPFNPNTTISFSIPHTNYVTLNIYDILGKEVATLVNEEKSAGNYEAEFDGSQLASGTYIYTITAGNFRAARKLMILK